MNIITFAYVETIFFAVFITFIVSLVFACAIGRLFVYKEEVYKEEVNELVSVKAIVVAFILPYFLSIFFLNLECGQGEYENLTDIKNQAEHVKPEVTEKIKEFSKDGKITLFEYYVVSNLSDEISRRYKRQKIQEEYEKAKLNAIN